jgi:hypothetical protein
MLTDDVRRTDEFPGCEQPRGINKITSCVGLNSNSDMQSIYALIAHVTASNQIKQGLGLNSSVDTQINKALVVAAIADIKFKPVILSWIIFNFSITHPQGSKPAPLCLTQLLLIAPLTLIKAGCYWLLP